MRANRTSSIPSLVALAFALALLPACRRARRLFHRGPHVVAAHPPLPPERVARGREAYLRYCALCHRADGTGYAADHANAVANPDFLRAASDTFLRVAIADGRPGTPMSAWSRARGGPLDNTTIDDLVMYLRSRARLSPVRVDARRVARGSIDEGRTLYAQRCQSCHGPRGQGSAVAASLSHPNFQRNASDGFIRYAIEHGRRGTPMPAFASLGDRALDDLVSFVRTLRAEPPAPVPAPVYEPPPGLDQLVINPRGRNPEFALREDRFVPVADVARALTQHQRMVILDARATSDWDRGHIPGALPFPFYNIEDMAGRLPNDGTWILAYCACPHAASGHVVDELRRRHFAHTAVIDEGIPGWIAQGFPTARANVVGGASAPAAPAPSPAALPAPAIAPRP